MEATGGSLCSTLAEYKSRKTISAPPLKWGGPTSLAQCHSWNTLQTEEAIEVLDNPRNKLFQESALRLRAMLNGIKERHGGKLTLF
jgi:hypothetical protein